MRLTVIMALMMVFLAACSSSEPVETPPPNPTEATEPTVEEETPSEEQPDVTSGDDRRSSRVQQVTSSWETDWTQTTIDTSELLVGLPRRDGIPSIDEPKFTTIIEADEWMGAEEPVMTLVIDGDARAYPLSILTRHEIVNDEVGGEPVAVTFCPLCNSALVFKSTVDGEVYEFGVSGLLRNSDLVMYDRTTESLWQQFTGEGIVGEHAGDQLEIVPSGLISLEDFAEAYPDGRVLSPDTGIYPEASYGRNPYEGYDSLANTSPFLFAGDVDERLPAVLRVVGVVIDDEAIAYPYDALAEQSVVNDEVAGQAIVIFHQFGVRSALGDADIATAEDVGGTGVFDPTVNDEVLTFTVEDGVIVDENTGSTWNLAGQAVDGELVGTQLVRLPSTDHFWFSWAAFYPDTTVWEAN